MPTNVFKTDRIKYEIQQKPVVSLRHVRGEHVTLERISQKGAVQMRPQIH